MSGKGSFGIWRGWAARVAILIPAMLSNAVLAADIGGYIEDRDARQAAERTASQIDSFSARARAGDPDAQFWLGSAYRNGWGVGADPIVAATWLREAADQGHAKAQHTLGTMYESGEGVPANLQKARELFKKSAGQGFAAAQVSLAAMILRASDGDMAEAYMWFELAAASGDTFALRGLSALATRMPQDDLERAQELVRNWVPTTRQVP